MSEYNTQSTTYTAGYVTAYGAAKRGGYTGSYADFCEAIAGMAGVVGDLESFSVVINTLSPGSQATASYADGVLTLGVPQGAKGDKGDKGDTGEISQAELDAAIDEVSDEIDALKNDLSDVDTQLGMLITKAERPQPVPTQITQVADLTEAILKSTTNYKYYASVKVYLPWVGRYDMNPSNLNMKIYYISPYDASGNVLALYRNGTVVSNSQINGENGGYFEKVDARTIKTYTETGTLKWTWTTDEDIAYLSGTGNNGCIGNFSDSEQLVGVTFGGASETYIPYGESISSAENAEIEYDYNYADELDEHIIDCVENGADTEPTPGSNKFAKSGGIVSYSFKQSYNLFDPAWLDWDNVDGTYVSMYTGIYISVTAGNKICGNCSKISYIFYDNTKTQLSTSGTVNTYAPVAIPENTAFIRIKVNYATGIVPSDHNVTLYYTDYESNDDIRPYIPTFNLIGSKGSSEIFDHYAPSDLGSEILKMGAYRSQRLYGYVNNSIRIASYNLYNPRQPYNWEQLKNILADYAIDISVFQEVQGGTMRRVGQFLKGWQFPYVSTMETIGESPNPTAQVGHFKMISSTSIADTYNPERKYSLCVYELPMYGGKVTPTLAVLDYHGTIYAVDGVPGSEIRPLEITEMLGILANTTADFKIVLGDTNAMDLTDGYPNNWKQWSDAGYTPVFGADVFTTIDNYCIDNIFLGTGMTALSKHIVSSTEYPVVVNDPSNPVPLSDHNMIFADIQFDFDSLLS